MMLALLHIPYVLVVVRGDELAPKAITFFLYIARMLAVLGVVQYFLQGIVDKTFLYPIDNLLPPDFVVQGVQCPGHGQLLLGSDPRHRHVHAGALVPGSIPGRGHRRRVGHDARAYGRSVCMSSASSRRTPAPAS